MRSYTQRTHPVKAAGQPECGDGSLSGRLCGLVLRRPVPGEQVVDPLCRIVGQPRQHVGEPGLGINAVELGGLDQGVDGGGAPAAFV